jgi:hypothetical protein
MVDGLARASADGVNATLAVPWCERLCRRDSNLSLTLGALTHGLARPDLRLLCLVPVRQRFEIAAGVRLFLVSLLVGCAVPSAYQSQARPGASATVLVRSARVRPGESWTGQFDVYDFSGGCPELGVRMKSSGYQGSVEISRGGTATIVVPTGRYVVLKSAWKDLGVFTTTFCDAVLAFRPVNGERYIYEYRGPGGNGRSCDAHIGQVVLSPEGTEQIVEVASARYPRLSQGMSGLEAPGLCTLAQQEAASAPEPRSALAAGPPPVPAAGDPPARAADDPSQRHAVDDPPPHVVDAPRIAPVLPGTGFRLALGYAAGGDNILRATFTNGATQTLSAGQGWFGAIGGTVTPVWIGRSIGFGFGADIGWKVDSVDASNGGVRLSRFPLAGWLQMLAGGGEKWWFFSAAGVHKELGPELSGDGDAASVNQSFDSSLGWLAELGLYFRESRHGGVGGSIRYTSAHYRLASTTIDASSVGFALTLHFRP